MEFTVKLFQLEVLVQKSVPLARKDYLRRKFSFVDFGKNICTTSYAKSNICFMHSDSMAFHTELPQEASNDPVREQLKKRLQRLSSGNLRNN